MYIAEILEYDFSYFDIFHRIGMQDEHMLEFMEWSFGKVVSYDRRDWYRKWNRFHGKYLHLTFTPQTPEDWTPLALVWSAFKSGRFQ